jgi:hypothetical protein
VACPFFMPVSISEDITWLHSSRLPLGAGWNGRCGAPGHEGEVPSHHELKDLCNLGYAASCSRLPERRAWDAVRFSVYRDQGRQLVLWFVCELAHRPAGHGMIEYDVTRAQWTSTHPDPRVQKMADCYVQSYLQRRIQPASRNPVPGANSN